MTSTINNFTGDVIALLAVGGKDDRLRILRSVKNEPLPDFIRTGVCVSLVEFMENAPPFVRQIVARVLVEHVDWDAVAQWAVTDPEAN